MAYDVWNFFFPFTKYEFLLFSCNLPSSLKKEGGFRTVVSGSVEECQSYSGKKTKIPKIVIF